VYCVEGSVQPTDTSNGVVSVGYYSTPTFVDADVRQAQIACPASYYCFQGLKVRPPLPSLSLSPAPTP
jgi:hypothetical protein